MRKIRLFSIAALALVMAACSSDDNMLETQSPAANGKLRFTATIEAPGTGATTRTEYTEITSGDDAGTINVKWKVGDKIALVHNGVVDEAEVKTVDDVTGKATIEADITGSPKDNDDVYLAYPADAVSSATPSALSPSFPFEPNLTSISKLGSQDGTLEFIQNNLDLRMGDGKLAVSGDKVTLKESVSIPSLICIWKLTLQDNAATPSALNATKLTVKYGTSTQALATSTGKSAYYLAIVPSMLPSGDLTIEATVGSDTYTYTKTGTVSLTAGKYYKSTVTMAKASVPVTAITLNKTATTIEVSNNETLSVSSITPDDATDQTVTWSSDNTDVATVNATTGEVTAVAVGTANITATANDGSGVTATCAVTVTPKLYSFTITGPYTGNQLVVEFYEGDTWNDMITKYPSTLKKISKWVGFSTDGLVTDPSTNDWVEVTDQLVPNRAYYVE